MDDFNTAVLNDHDLLYGGVEDLVLENRASARRWARLVELHRRQPDTDGSFAMTAREWTALKTSEVWATGARFSRSQLNIALFLAEHLTEVWELCLSGALDRFRAMTIADIVRHRLDDPADWAVVAPRVAQFLRQHLRAFPEFNISVVTCTITQLRNKLNYETRKLAPADAEFVRAYDDRAARAIDLGDGMGALSVTSSLDKVLIAERRLHRAAKAKRAEGDPRSVRQLMSDLAIDLIVGLADGVPVPQFARPIINVTVSLETLAGLADDPATLSGGAVIPAELARAIALGEGATWYRLLTDPQGDPVSLSTKSYQPTAPIWRSVVAVQPTCAHPACDRPAVVCELDHDQPWPLGPTDTRNLRPRCRFHHKAKHALVERPDLWWEFGLDPRGLVAA